MPPRRRLVYSFDTCHDKTLTAIFTGIIFYLEPVEAGKSASNWCCRTEGWFIFFAFPVDNFSRVDTIFVGFFNNALIFLHNGLLKGDSTLSRVLYKKSVDNIGVFGKVFEKRQKNRSPEGDLKV